MKDNNKKDSYNINIFNKRADDYESWFSSNEILFKTEASAIKHFLPENLADYKSLEIGVGTGKFAQEFKIQSGVEPADNMAKISHKKGIDVIQAKAESLPYANATFDYVFFITVLCFTENPLQALKEAYRVLKPKGKIILASLDLNSSTGKLYAGQIKKSTYYLQAQFFSPDNLKSMLIETGFTNLEFVQTVFKHSTSSFKILAIDTFILDDGISTFKCPAFTAFLILVSMSAIGSDTLLIFLP